ncbi:MAG: peptidylprolyl isomerase [Spirochaetota bacterium]
MSTPKQAKNPQQQEKQHRSVGKTLTYAMTVLLLVIVVIAFVGTPAVGGLSGGNRISFGSYAGREIVYEPGNFLARQYQDVARVVQQQDQQVTDTLIRQVWRTAFQRAVFHEAMMVIAEQADVAVSAQAVDRAVARWPEFQVEGRFSAEAYNATSNQARFALREYLRDVLVDTQVQLDLYGETLVSTPEQEFLVGLAGPERRFDFVQFSFSDFPDTEVIDYGQTNPDLFRRINLSVITVSSSEADAASIREQAVSRQTSFEDLARNQSRDSYSEDGGLMGWVYYHELEPDFENTEVIEEIFELDEGEISRVFQTTFGWTIYRVNDAPIAPDFTDDDVIAAVRDYLTVFERGIIEDYLNARADEFVSSAREDGFDTAASEIDQSPAATSWFPINYGNTPHFGTVSSQSNQTLSAAAFREEFFEELFALGSGEVSEPIVVRDYVFVFELADEREPDEASVDRLASNMDLIVRELTREQVQDTLVDDDRLVDNFNSTYNRVILGR